MFYPYFGIENHPAGTKDINPIINGNWKALVNAAQPAYGFTATQDNGTSGVAGNQIRASAAIFTSDDNGATVRFADGSTATITSVTNSTLALATDSKLVLVQAFEIYRSNESQYTAYARALLKKVRFIAGDDGKTIVWDNTLKRFVLATRSGYGIAATQVLYGGGAGVDAASSADLVFDNTTKILTLNGRTVAKNYEFTHATIASATSITIDFTLEGLRSINTLAHNVTFASSNRSAGRTQTIRIVCDGTTRTLAFPAGWVFLNAAAPANIVANKTGVLSVTAFGTNDADCVAVWAVQP